MADNPFVNNPFATAFLDAAKNFKLPGLDMNALVDANRQNLEAIAKSAQALTQGGQAVATKQQEIMTGLMQEIQSAVAGFKPPGNPQEIAAKQSELARTAFNAAVENLKDSAAEIQKSGTEASSIIMARVKEAVASARAAMEPKA